MYGNSSYEEFESALVIDNGSYTIKAGIAGEEQPSVVMPTCIGIPKHRQVIIGTQQRKDKFFFGSGDEKDRDGSWGLCKLVYPCKNGVISGSQNMEHMRCLWDQMYKDKRIDIPKQDHPVLLTEAVNNPIRNRVETAKIFFEQFNVPALYFAPAPVISLYAANRTTGCILDCGHGLSSVVPVCEGFAIPHAIQRIDLGGDEITKYFSHLLRKSGCKLNRTSSELEIVRKIKEEECELQVIKPSGIGGIGAMANARGMARGGTAGGDDDSKNNADYQYINDDLNLGDGASGGIVGAASASNAPKYELPDGTVLSIGSARYRAPEILFNPSIIGAEYGGIQDCIYDCINKCDLDLRRSLYKEIVLTGGTTQTKNFGRRLVTELQDKVAKKAKIKVYAPMNRNFIAWIGGSLLATLVGFRPMWVTKADHDECGASILFRKSFF